MPTPPDPARAATPDDGGSAFPDSGGGRYAPTGGMSLRDYFAAAALTGLCANTGYQDQTYSAAALQAFKQADALLASRRPSAKEGG